MLWVIFYGDLKLWCNIACCNSGILVCMFYLFDCCYCLWLVVVAGGFLFVDCAFRVGVFGFLF